MEILILVLLYYFSQNPDFAESVKPLMNKLKDSEQMLRFLNDLSKFTQTFSTFQQESQKPNEKEKKNPPPPPPKKEECKEERKDEDKKNPQSPTSGIADEFIQSILDSYLKKN